MKYLILSILIALTIQVNAQKDYVQLVIPEGFKNNTEAVEYLENDAEQLNKLFNNLDAFITDFEDLILVIDKIDTTNVEQMKAMAPAIEKELESLSYNSMKFMFNLMWYIGKDVFSNEEAAKKMITKLDTEDGVVYQKSLDHIKLKKELLEARANEFVKKLETLDIPK